MNRLTETSRRYGLDINVNKTKLTIVSKNKYTNCTLNINQRPDVYKRQSKFKRIMDTSQIYVSRMSLVNINVA